MWLRTSGFELHSLNYLQLMPGFEWTSPLPVLLGVDPMNDDLSANLEQEQLRAYPLCHKTTKLPKKIQNGFGRGARGWA